ncbi:hypothetical protein C5167_026711 [Papaver somniferum]|nr:hypothetical protein C5167_026711 [Papaver somniferum]
MSIPFPQFTLLVLLITTICALNCHGFTIKEATINDIQLAFKSNTLTSRQLVELYIKEIQTHNPLLNAVIEVNPDVLNQADKADYERRNSGSRLLGALHGIPILLKDNIATKDKLSTTAGSFALLKSVVPRDAGVVRRLRKSGALILGKASLSEWSNFRGTGIPSGWLWKRWPGKVSLGTETDGSILCPAGSNSVVGFKPTVGLTSRAGVIPISPRQDSVGPITRTVSDAVYVLDAIVGFDPNDAVATSTAAKFIPRGGYSQFLNKNGLRGKRLGIVNAYYSGFPTESLFNLFVGHLEKLRQAGAILVDNLEIDNLQTIYSPQSGEQSAMSSEFKQSLNVYLKDLMSSPVRSLADVIAFNTNNPSLEMTDVYNQNLLVEAEKTAGTEAERSGDLLNMEKLDNEGFKSLMIKNNLDAVVAPGFALSTPLAIGGHPGIIVPAGYGDDGMPIGICFGGLRGSEPKLIEIAYGFEQITLVRKPPFLTTLVSNI